MAVTRRSVLKLSAGAGVAAASGAPVRSVAQDLSRDWEAVRALFSLTRNRVHMSTMLIASHPAPVRDAIERHRRALDADPVVYLVENEERLTEASRAAAARYLGMHPAHVALTDSTTMGVGLIYTGLDIGADKEVLTSDEDYYVTHESLRHLSRRTGARQRRIALFDDVSAASAEGIVARIVDEIRPETRLLALTWVHSSTGLKMPVGEIGQALREINARRDPQDQVLFGLDAVHGFGVETENFFELGVDYLMAGAHKWLFGPRGTGIAALSPRGLAAVRPTIPSFDDSRIFSAWYTGQEGRPPLTGESMTPGGFKAFEHRWALADAFALHEEIGRQRIADRTHALAGALKEALRGIDGVTVVTPQDAELSSGIVSFDVAGQGPRTVVARLGEAGIVASVSPYLRSLVRLTPSIRNTAGEVGLAAQAVRALV